MGSYVLKKAEMDQLSAAMDLISDGKRYLKEQGSDQWQTGYPDETDIREDILRGRGYFVTDGTQPLAYLCVDFEGEPAYGQIRGQWLTDSSPYGVIHRLAIRSESRGKGLSREIFSLAEELCGLPAGTSWHTRKSCSSFTQTGTHGPQRCLRSRRPPPSSAFHC